MAEQQGDKLNLSSIAINTNTELKSQISQGMEIRQEIPLGTMNTNSGFNFNSKNRIKHVYLQEENVYGRFVPFLLLKDQLHSQIDSSGTTALIHMCSHNSPFLPLYLSTLNQNDPILNKATPAGHTPLDVAGLYCRKQYVELLRQKGAIDNGKVDHWAIQGANIANWSGQIDPSKKQLIHWAAYNDLPQVLLKYNEAGCNVNEADVNGNAPIDLAVINKSYDSFEVLAKLGFRPKQKLIQQAQSPYMKKYLSQLDKNSTYKAIINSLKLAFIPIILLSQSFIVQPPNLYLTVVSFCLWAYLIIHKPLPDDKERPTSFFSQIFNKQINYISNHKAYVLFFIFVVLNTIITLIQMETKTFFHAFAFWLNIAFFIIFGTNLIILLYGIFTNTTPNQMFQSHKNKHLWPKIDYLPHKNMLIRVYKNQKTKDIISNLKEYLKS